MINDLRFKNLLKIARPAKFKRSGWKLKIALACLLLLPVIALLIGFSARQNDVLRNAKLVVNKKVFGSYEKPQFKIILGENKNTSFIGSVFAQSAPVVKAKFERANDSKTELKAKITRQGQTYSIAFDPSAGFTGGKYILSATIQDGGAHREFTQDFTWGVLALNPDKVTYSPGKTSNISIGVLDENGGVICDADLWLTITKPDGTKELKTTDNGSIETTTQCHSKEESIVPDYQTSLKLGSEGTYGLDLKAKTRNGTYEIKDYIKVSSNIAFDIKRQSATRLYPKNTYPMTINITANQDYKGTVSETVPQDFAIIKTKQDQKTTDYAAKITEKTTYRLIQWQADWKKGQNYTLSYVYQGPRISPQFYLIGNLTLNSSIINHQSSIIYEEGRFWELANDDTQVVINASNPISCGANCATIPSDWTSTNHIEVVGAGGTGATASASLGGAGGGGGGYARLNNQAFTGGTNVGFFLGVGGGGGGGWGDTYFCSSTLSCNNSGAANVIAAAKGGGNAAGAAGGQGGAGITPASGGTLYTGGNGGTGNATAYYPGAGGGGAAGPNGNGGPGGNTGAGVGYGGSGGGGNGKSGGGNTGGGPTTTTGGTGGAGYSGGAGGSGGSPGGTGTNGGGGGGGRGTGTSSGTGGTGGTGSMADEWGSSVQGTGGGAGGGGANGRTNNGTRAGGPGGVPGGNTGAGGGGGGSGNVSSGGGGTGSKGFIVITYTPAGVNISGNVYNAGTATPLTACDASSSTYELELATNGGLYRASCSNSDGSFTFTGVQVGAAGTDITIWIIGGSVRGSLNVRYSGSGASTNNVLYGNTVAVTSDDTNAVTNSIMGYYDGNASPSGIMYTVSTGNLTVNSGYAFLAELKSGVTSGSTVYSPGGTITTNVTGGDFTVGTNALAQITTATSAIGGNVTVNSGATLDINAATTISGGSITNSGTFDSTAGSVTLSGTGSITNSGTFTFSAVTFSGTTTTSSSFGVTGALTVSGSSSFDGSSGGAVTFTGGSISNSGTLKFGGLTISATTTTTSSFSIYVALSVGASGTFQPGSASTISMYSGSSISNSNTAASLDFYNLTIASGTISPSTSFTISNNITVSSGATFSPSAGTITMTGGTIVNNAASDTNLDFYGLTITTATVTTTSNFDISQAFTVSSGSFTASSPSVITITGGSITSGTLSFYGLTISGTTTTSSSFGITGSLSVGVSGVFQPTGGTITMSGTSSWSIANSNTAASLDFSTLSLSTTPASQPSTNFTISANLTVANGAVFQPSNTIYITGGTIVNNNVTPSNLTFTGLNVGGTVTTSSSFSVTGALNVSSGSFTASGGTITMTGTGWTIGNSGSLTFSGLTIGGTPSTAPSASFTAGNAGGVFTVSSLVSFTPSAGTVTMSGGSIANSSGTDSNLTFQGLTIGGTVTTSTNFYVAGALNVSSGSFTASSDTITMTGASGSIANSGTLTFNNLTTSGTTVTTSSNFTIGGNLNVSSGSLTASGGTVTMNGTTKTISNSGTLSFSGLTISGTVSADSQSFNITGATSVTGTLSVGAGTGTITATGDVTGTGTVTLTYGTFNQNIGAGHNFGPTGSNNWTFNNLTFSSSLGSQTVTTSSGTGNVSVGNVLTVGTGITLNAGTKTWTLSGTSGTPFSLSGGLTPSTSTFAYTGNAAGNTTLADTTYFNLTVNNGSETFVPGNTTLTINGDLNVTAGTLDTTGNTLNVGSATAATGDVNVSGTLQATSGTVNVYAPSAGTPNFGGAGTINIYNLSFVPAVASAPTFTLGSGAISVNNLTIGNGTNGVSVSANSNNPAITVSGAFLINTGGTFLAPPSASFTVSGNFTNNGTFTDDSGTVTFNGGGSTTLAGSGSPAIVFNNFTSTTPGKTLIFTAAEVFEIDGAFTITGTSANHINIQSTSSIKWQIKSLGTAAVTYATITNSGGASGSNTILLNTTNTDGGVGGTNDPLYWDFLQSTINVRMLGNTRIKGNTRIMGQ